MTIDTGGTAPAAAPAPSADVNDELLGAGVAFGDLIRLTGQAVAATQRELEKTAAESIKALSQQQVEIVAAEVLDYDDEGVLRASAPPVVQSLPLITIVDPPVYQWEHVRVQGLFFAREFGTATSSSTRVDDTSAGANAVGVGGTGMPFLGRARASFQHTTTTTTVDTTTETDASYGLMRLNALLKPRTDTGIPKPRQVIVGPSIRFTRQPTTTVTSDGTTTRSVAVRIGYFRPDGSAIEGKSLSIDAAGLEWDFEDNDGSDSAVTDANGVVNVTVRRTLDADTTPKDVLLSARIGLVRNDLAISL
jgi:hypothetical protein